MGDKDRQFAPLRKFTFPAGECGGEIRVNIPTTASKADVIPMARMLMVAAEEWEEPDDFLN